MASARDPEAAYRDTSIDDPEAPLLHSPVGYSPINHSNSNKPIINMDLSVTTLRHHILALSIPFSIAAAALVPDDNPAVQIYSVIIWSFITTWTTARLIRACILSRRQKQGEGRWSCCGLMITWERMPSKKGSHWPWIVRGCDATWIVLAIPATVLATTEHVWDHWDYRWDGRGAADQERALLACGSIVMILYAINIVLTFLPTDRKLRLSLTPVREEALALPTTRQTGPISVQA